MLNSNPGKGVSVEALKAIKEVKQITSKIKVKNAFNDEHKIGQSISEFLEFRFQFSKKQL